VQGGVKVGPILVMPVGVGNLHGVKIDDFYFYFSFFLVGLGFTSEKIK